MEFTNRYSIDTWATVIKVEKEKRSKSCGSITTSVIGRPRTVTSTSSSAAQRPFNWLKSDGLEDKTARCSVCLIIQSLFWIPPQRKINICYRDKHSWSVRRWRGIIPRGSMPTDSIVTGEWRRAFAPRSQL